MKLYVSSLSGLVNKERAQSILEEVGIIKEIDGFSDCLNECTCEDFKGGLEIRFDLYKRVFTRKNRLKQIFINPVKNLFLDGDNKKLTWKHNVAGLYYQDSREKQICLFLDKLTEKGMDIRNMLIHELMHISKPVGHCDKGYFIFSGGYEQTKSSKLNQVGLCEDCQKIYNKILEEINEVQNKK